MLDYTLAGGLPAGNRTVWSNPPLRPLAPGLLTPFSFSVLAEILGRACYQYFDRLGFEPTPRPRVLRQVNGAPYLNLSLTAQRAAEQAAIEPITLQINGQAFPVCHWEKPGLLAGLKAAMKERKVGELLQKLEAELPGLTQKAEAWYNKVKDFRWTQAEILLIMEEIEPVATPMATAFLAASLNRAWLINRLLRALPSQAKSAANWLATDSLIDAQLVDERRKLTDGDQAVLAAFLSKYGQHAANVAELRTPRWGDDPTSARLDQPGGAVTGAEQTLLASADPKQRKAVADWWQQAQRWQRLQSQAQHALAYMLAGTRRWALAAAHEAQVDQRILELDDVFFFELEEMKRMMTGEWNVSDSQEIQATAAKRRREYETWQANRPIPAVIIGDVPVSV